MIDVLAIGAVSPLGIGRAAWCVGEPGAPATTRIGRDETLAAAGLRKPFAARTTAVHVQVEGDPATALLMAALSQIEADIPAGARLGVAIGTSSGGMATAERLFAARRDGASIADAPKAGRDSSIAALADGATYHAPFRALLAALTARGHRVVRSTHPVTACSASTIAIGLATRWLDAGAIDVAIAGGYDALTVFVAAGFEALGATTGTPPPRPFRVGRDGMSLGEGAGLFLLARPRDASPLARIAGFGAAGDAVHLTAPDRTGGGLASAAQRALAHVDRASIDLVSVHGTSTPFNDPMESKAIARALARPIGDVTVHAAKATIGHTLGAAGVLESALAIDALRRGVVPATPGEGELDPEVGARPLSTNERGNVRAVLKLSAAFGGANAALALLPADASVTAVSTTRWAVREVAAAQVDAADADRFDVIEASSGVSRERLARMDQVCRLALHAVGKLSAETSRELLRGAAIVLGSVLATIDVNAVYDDGLRRRGAAHAEGRRFAYTTPNAAAGECAIAFGLTGPNVAVSRGPDAATEAEEVAQDLIAAGDAERVVVVDVDAEGPVAIELAQATGWPVRFGARARLLERA